MIDFGNGNGFFSIMYTAVVALSGAIAKEINDKVRGKESFAIFIADVALHGFSGWLVGLGATQYLHLTDITSITIFAGIGGLFGYDLVRTILNMVLDKVRGSTPSSDKKDQLAEIIEDKTAENNG